jgi:hypothetical protein
MMSGSPFFLVDYDVPCQYSFDPTYAERIVSTLVEPDAIGHWLFGTDYPNIEDLVSGQKMVRQWRGNISASGSGYTDGVYNCGLTGGDSTGMVVKYRCTGGAVVDVWVSNYGTNFGTDYTVAPTLSFPSGGGTGAAATLSRTSAPTISANYLTIPAGMNALVTPFDDAAAQTYAMVLKKPAVPSSNDMVLGVYPASGNAYLDVIFASSAGFKTNVAGITVPAGTSTVTDAPGAVGDWLFLAHSVDASGWRTTWGNGSSYSLAGTKTVEAGHKTVMGSSQVTVGLDAALPVAELIAFNYGMSAAEHVALYNRTKARMAERGLTLL